MRAAGTAVTKCFVAVTALLTALLSLASALVRCVASLVDLLGALCARGAAVLRRTPTAPVDGRASRPVLTATNEVQATSPRAGQVATAPRAEQVAHALVGLGFRRPEVTRYVASLGARVATDDLRALIQDGIRTLGAN